MAAADDQRKKDHRVHEGKGYMVLLAEIWLVAAISKYIQVPSSQVSQKTSEAIT